MAAATAQPPARPGLDTAELFEPDRRDWLRLLGGVLLAAGAVVLYIRKFEAWGEFLKLLVVLVPFVVLYGLGWLGGVRHRGVGEGVAGDGHATPQAEGWQSAFLILGTVFVGFVVAQLFLTLGADDLEARLHQVAIGVAVAAAAYAASFLRHIPFLSVVGGLAALWAWLFLWDKIIDVDKIGTGRALLLIFAAIVLAGAIALRAAKRPQAADFVTVAGITAILAGLLSVSNLSAGFNPVGDAETKPTEIWNVFILVVSLALIGYGSKAATRGPSYVGALGLIAFAGLAGANAVAIFSGNLDDREQLVGWPLLLLLLGIAGLVASFLLPREGAGGRGPTTAPEGVAGAPRPGAGYDQGQYGAPGQQPAPGGYAPQQQQPQQQPTQVRPQPQPSQQPPEAWPPPGQAPGSQQQTRQYPQQPPPQGGPAADQTVARPIPPPPPDDPGQPGR